MRYIAHRGYSKLFAENSLPAFQAVIDHPRNGHELLGIELDIHLTADGRIPVMHETTVPDDTGIPVPVANLTFNELQQLFRQHHGSAIPPVPSIEQVLELVNHQTELCFEIKIGSYDLNRFITLFEAALQRYTPRRDIVISSFSYEILEQTRQVCGQFDLRYGYLFELPEALQAVPHDVRNRFDFLHPWYPLLFATPELFRPSGPPLRCWTVNDAETVARIGALPLPIEAVMTDDIALAGQAPEAAS